MTELGELHQRILAAQARIQHNIVRTPVLRSAQSQHTRAWIVQEDFPIPEMPPTLVFSWLKAPTSTFTFKTILGC